MLRQRSPMKLMKATVFLGETDARPSATYTVVAASARHAAELISGYLGLRQSWERIDIIVLADGRVEGPARVLGPVSDDVNARK